MAIDGPQDSEQNKDLASGRWMEHPMDKNNLGGKNVNPHEPQTRDVYHFWANTHIYCFVRLFLMLYERLAKMKAAEEGVRKAVHDAKQVKPAIELGISRMTLYKKLHKYGMIGAA